MESGEWRVELTVRVGHGTKPVKGRRDDPCGCPLSDTVRSRYIGVGNGLDRSECAIRTVAEMTKMH